jgi:two-component system sensor histidine kinase/response regulator
MGEGAAEVGSVVVVDDDYAMRLSCEQALAKVGYHVHTFEDGARGLAAVAELKPDLVVVDLKMPGLSGLDVITRLHEIDPAIIIVVITGYATISTAIDAMKAGAYDFLPKPFAPDELRLIVRRGFERRRLQRLSQQCEVDRELQRRRFVTFVSHQLKTPLVAIHQYLDVLRQLGDTPQGEAKRREWLDRCLVRADELRCLIDDWLTLAQLEGGKLGRQRVPVNLVDVIRPIATTYEEMAAHTGVTIAADVPDCPCVVRGDPTCLTVLVDNLLANAIKYNKPCGTVHIGLEAKPGEVVLEVADTGIGIPAAALPLLFDEFFRVGQSGPHRIEGTGLGLPICRKIASEHGGVIEVESTEGVGSTFRVRLPATVDSAAAQEQPA